MIFIVHFECFEARPPLVTVPIEAPKSCIARRTAARVLKLWVTDGKVPAAAWRLAKCVEIRV